MKKIFYDTFISIEEISLEFQLNDIPDNEKEEYLSLIDETFHLHLLDVILDYLPKEFHEDFLKIFQEKPDDEKILPFLKEKTAKDIESILRSEADKVKKEIIKEIKKSKKK